jgi:hypothetical protein
MVVMVDTNVSINLNLRTFDTRHRVLFEQHKDGVYGPMHQQLPSAFLKERRAAN